MGNGIGVEPAKSYLWKYSETRFHYSVWLWHFAGLSCAVVSGSEEQEQSKYIWNGTALSSINKWSDSICNPLETFFFFVIALELIR